MSNIEVVSLKGVVNRIHVFSLEDRSHPIRINSIAQFEYEDVECEIPHQLGIGEENETFFIRVWKPLPSRCVLKILRASPKGRT